MLRIKDSHSLFGVFIAPTFPFGNNGKICGFSRALKTGEGPQLPVNASGFTIAPILKKNKTVMRIVRGQKMKKGEKIGLFFWAFHRSNGHIFPPLPHLALQSWDPGAFFFFSFQSFISIACCLLDDHGSQVMRYGFPLLLLQFQGRWKDDLMAFSAHPQPSRAYVLASQVAKSHPHLCLKTNLWCKISALPCCNCGEGI